MELTTTIPASSMTSLAWLKGRVIGALVCGSLGAIWMFEAVYLGGIPTPIWLPTIWMLTIAFIVWPVIRLRSFPPLRRSLADRQRWAGVAKTYWIIVAIEWGLCTVAAIWLAHLHRFHLIPVWLGVIIGIHFLPLAKMFTMPIYYLTGAAMTLGVLATLLIPAPHARHLAAYSVDGLVLWATAAFILCQGSFSPREVACL